MELRYGTNPHQTSARLETLASGRAPIRLVSGTPSYINLLDALNAWELVREAPTRRGIAGGNVVQARVTGRRRHRRTARRGGR